MMLNATFFATPIGTCSLVWGEAGIRGIYLPEASEKVLRTRVARRFPVTRETAPAGEIDKAIAGIVDLLGGGRDDLTWIALDMRGLPDFDLRVYEAAPGSPVIGGQP